MSNKYIEIFNNKCNDLTNISDIIAGVTDIDSEIFIALIYECLMDASNEEKQEVIDACDYVCSLLDTEEKKNRFVEPLPEMPLLFAIANDFTDGQGNSKIYDMYEESLLENFSLETVKTYLFVDEPLIYLAKDNNEQLFFCMAIPDNCLLIARVSAELVIQIENNQIPIRDVFLHSTEEDLILIDERNGIATNMHPNDLAEKMLPPSGEYLSDIKE
jgi:hypothetical protein